MQFIDLKAQYTALKREIDARIQRVLDHGQYIMGPEVRELEDQLAAFTGIRHCVTVSSGTEALLIALMALELKPGDEVITSPFTFAATGEVIALLGAKPVFVDIEPDTCLIDASLIEARITERTRAIMPVSLYGQCADMAAINEIAARHGLPVIEDAAQSFGATYTAPEREQVEKNTLPRRSGALSTIGCTSFFPSKPLGCYGDGGALFTDRDDIAEAARQIRVHGQGARYRHDRIGVGGRMDTLQCAVVLAKLPRLEWELQRRREIGQRYRAAIEGSAILQGAGVRPVAQRPGRDSVHGQYTVLLPSAGSPQPALRGGRADSLRDALQKAMAERGVPTAVHYPLPLHHQKAYAAYCCPECCPNSISAAARVMSLPMSADLSDEDQQRVLKALEEAVAAVMP